MATPTAVNTIPTPQDEDGLSDEDVTGPVVKRVFMVFFYPFLTAPDGKLVGQT